MTGGSKLPGWPGHALAKKDVTRSVDDGHVGHAVTVQVSDEGRVVRNEADGPGLRELTVSLVQLDHDGVGGLRRDGQVGPAVAGEVARRDDGRIDLASEFERRHDLEPAPAVTLEQGNRVGVGIGDRQVKRAAAEKVSGGD